jgi:predicted P-loop ATPase
VLANVLTALREAPEWQGVIWFDEFGRKTVIRKRAPWMVSDPAEAMPWTPQFDTLACEWCQKHGLFVGVDVVATAVECVAREHSFHPIREYLSGLEWDGKPRIDTWLCDYFGTPDSEYSRAIAARWLISAVARVFQPGCKADHTLVLEGRQGAKKSSALSVLASPWFTDQVDDFESKDAILQIHQGWIVEFAELDALGKSELARIKQFLTRTADRYRPPYAKREVDEPRQCVFAGTINLGHAGYLKDETGNRRFWPVEVRVKAVDLDALALNRPQLWAEAVWRYRAGEVWYLDTEELAEAAEREQAARFEWDAWTDKVLEYCEGRSSVSIPEILDGALQKPIGTWTQVDKNRVGRILRANGWERFQAREGELRTWRFKKWV